MGRSFSNAKAVYTAVVANRSASSTLRSASPSLKEPTKISWVPDPVTGYYRPETHVNETHDAAELRAMLLLKNNKNNTGHH